MQYSLDNKINNGKFGIVYKVHNNNKHFAAKILPKHRITMTNVRNIEMINREINHHKKVNNHPNIVKLIDVVEDWGNYFLIEELCEKGDLNSYMDHKLRISEITKILRDCLNGLIACH
jgi:serine/threonine protein kinase